MAHVVIEPGQSFGCWTVIAEGPRRQCASEPQRQFFCRCRCGNEKLIGKANLVNSPAKCRGGCIKTDRVLRFWDYVNKTDGCWNWTNSLHRGYGSFRSAGQKPMRAHRFSYILHFGPIPAGLLVCHHCDNPSCVRPDHLFLGTNSDNMADMKRKKRSLYGEQNPKARLSEDSVRLIRQLHAEGRSMYSLARQFSVIDQHISNIVKRKLWKHVV